MRLATTKNLVKRKKRVIAIAGERKIDAVRAALNGKLFNTAFKLSGRRNWLAEDLTPGGQGTVI
jgi:hypothetical protein